MRGAQSTNPFDEPLPLSHSATRGPSAVASGAPARRETQPARASSTSAIGSTAAPPARRIAEPARVAHQQDDVADSRHAHEEDRAPVRTAPAPADPPHLLSDDDYDEQAAARGAANGAERNGDINDRFVILVERYRDIKEKSNLLKKAYRAKQAEVDALITKGRKAEMELRKATENADKAQFNHDKLTKQVKALQGQLKEEKEKAGQGGWFSSGAKADLERCKVALVAARGELRRKIVENETLHKQIWEKQQESDKAIQLLRDKIHSLTNEIRELHESDEIKQRMWDEQKRELRAAREDAERQWTRTEGERVRTVAALADSQAALERMTQSEAAARDALARIKLEVVMFDDGTALCRHDAPSTCFAQAGPTSGTAAADDGWKGVVEAHRALGAALSHKARAIEAAWNTYGGGGGEEVAVRTVVRSLWAWAGRATPPTGLASVHALRRFTLALATLKLRPPLSETGQQLERAMRSATRAVGDAGSARATSSRMRGVHSSARPRLARRYETLLEGLRDVYREIRAAWASLVAAEANTQQQQQQQQQQQTASPVDKALETCVGSCGAAIALARQMRAEQEAGKAFARGRGREGAGALASGWATECATAVRFLAAVNHGIVESAPSVPYDASLANTAYMRDWQGREASLVAANAALQSQLAAVTAEKERVAEQWARTTDLLRQQRAALSKLALESQAGEGSAGAKAAAAAAIAVASTDVALSPAPSSPIPSDETVARAVDAVAAGGWRVRRVEGAGTGDDEDERAAAKQRARQAWEARVSRSETEAARWHGQYLELARAAQLDRDERAALREQVARTEALLHGWNEDKDALHRGYQEQLLVLNDHLIKQTELISAKDNEITMLQSNRVRCLTCNGWNTVGWLMANGGGKKCKYGNHVSGMNYAPASK